MQRGKFITFEGIDGTGKTTQIRLLRDELERAGHEVLLLREPGGTPISEQIRAILLDLSHRDTMRPETELLLFEAARAQLVREVVKPAIDAGTWVISDRFMDSSVAYQGYGRGLDIEMIHRLNRYAVGENRPDLTLLLVLPQHDLKRRLNRRRTGGEADRIDLESDRFREAVNEGFLTLAKAEPSRFHVVETKASKEETARIIYEIVRSAL